MVQGEANRPRGLPTNRFHHAAITSVYGPCARKWKKLVEWSGPAPSHNHQSFPPCPMRLHSRAVCEIAERSASRVRAVPHP